MIGLICSDQFIIVVIYYGIYNSIWNDSKRRTGSISSTLYLVLAIGLMALEMGDKLIDKG